LSGELAETKEKRVAAYSIYRESLHIILEKWTVVEAEGRGSS